MICWSSQFVILGMPGLVCLFYFQFFLWKFLLAYNEDIDVVSDLGPHCLRLTLLRVSW